MAFEDSPNLDGSTPARYQAGNWLFRYRRLILITVIGLTLLLAAFTLLAYLLGRPPDLGVGGLEGCLAAGDGSPRVAEIRLAGYSKMTGADGCFFFAALPPGNYEMQVLLENGEAWSTPVEIVADQALNLGTLTVK